METGSLYSYVKELARAAPITVDTILAFGLPGEARFAAGSERDLATHVLELLKESLGGLPQTDRLLVECHLFTGGTAERRRQRAEKKLREANPDISDTYAKNNLGPSLRRYVGALAERLEVFRPASLDQEVTILPRWFEVIGITWCLRIDADDYRRQHWERIIDLRSTIGDHPIVDFPQQWSGVGPREGAVKVLSGQQRPDAQRHQCLRVRPEGAQALDWDVYFFDLGMPLTPGKREILHYGETLFDEQDVSRPFIWQATARYGSLMLLEVIVDIPKKYGVTSMEAYREVPSARAATGYVPADTPTEVARDDCGLLRHGWRSDEIDHQSRYSVHWDDGYRKR
jgi:hypothetical protein